MQGHFGVKGYPAAELPYPFDIFRADGLTMLDTPAQSIKGPAPIHCFQGIQEGRDVLVVTDVPPEGDPSFYELRYIFLCESAHRIAVHNYGRLVKVLMVMQL